MIEKPLDSELEALIGLEAMGVWKEICDAIEREYDMNIAWNNGGKAWKYELKYSKGGKSLCALYAGENKSGLMIIFGGAERDKVETIRQELYEKTVAVYDEAKTYRDGKWVMFPLDKALIADYMRLLSIKRKPNKRI